MQAAEALDAAGDVGAILGRAPDVLQGAPGGGALRAGEQQLGAAQDHREEVVQMMGHAGGELAHRPQRLAAHQLLLGRLQVVHDPLELPGRLSRLLEEPRVVVEHLMKRARDPADLRDLTQARHRRQVDVAPGGCGLAQPRRLQLGEPGDLADHAPEDEEAQDRNRHGGQQPDLNVGAVEKVGA